MGSDAMRVCPIEEDPIQPIIEQELQAGRAANGDGGVAEAEPPGEDESWGHEELGM